MEYVETLVAAAHCEELTVYEQYIKYWIIPTYFQVEEKQTDTCMMLCKSYHAYIVGSFNQHNYTRYLLIHWKIGLFVHEHIIDGSQSS